MIWVVLLILAILAAYFIYQGLRARHVARCQYDQRTLENVPDSATGSHAQSEHSQQQGLNRASTETSAKAAIEPVPAPQDGPSLLYAERNASKEAEATANATLDNSPAVNRTSADVIDTHADAHAGTHAGTGTTEQTGRTDPMDFTAETATLSSDEVGHPANSSDYQHSTAQQNVESIRQTDASLAHGSVAANTQISESESKSATQTHSAQVPSSSGHDANAGSSTVSASALAAGAAGIAGVAAAVGVAHSSAQASNSGSAGHSISNEGIDLELGDSTNTDEQVHNFEHEVEQEDEHDELLDFGDMTADISEMLKELNLRESDSPRLEINEKEYQQLKTGEPGEVKPEKIENVAGKLRNMLQ